MEAAFRRRGFVDSTRDKFPHTAKAQPLEVPVAKA